MIQEALEHFVEPLSRATGDLLKPLRVDSTDRLAITVDEEGKRFKLKMYNATAVDGYPPPSYSSTNLFGRILECDYRGYGYECTAAITDTTILTIYHSFPADQIVFANDDIKNLYYLYLVRFSLQFDRTKEVAEFKEKRTPPVMPPDYRQHPELPFSDYQDMAVKFCLAAPTSAVFFDTGLGKTAIAIRYADTISERIYKKEKRMVRILVVAPAAVLVNWREEIGRFTTLRGKITILRGTKFKRVEQFAHAMTPENDCVFSVLVASYDTVSVAANVLTLQDWDVAIFDESQNVKDSKTQRFKALKILRDRCTNKVILTATPVGNSPMDLWSQLELLGEGMSGFSSFAKFRSVYGVWEPVYGASGVEKLVSLKNMPFLQERLSRLSFTMTKKEAGLQIPEKIDDIYEVEMTPEQARAYQKMRDELVVEFEGALNGNVDVMQANHILTSMLRLSQITSGFATVQAIVDEEGNEKTPKRVMQINPGANPKIQAVIEMLEDPERDPLSKTIIWCIYIEDIRAISEELTKRGIKNEKYYGGTSQDERDRIVQAFNNDDTLRVLICNPQTGGTGLNLLGYNPAKPDESKMYTGHNIFFSQGWSAIQRKQAEDRAHRRGTRCQVRNTDLIVADTIDEEIRRRVHAKREVASSITDLAEVLQNILK